MIDTSKSLHLLTTLLSQWVACGRLSYKFSVAAITSGRDGKPQIIATFSKPTLQTPAAEAVARLYFYLSIDLQRVCGFTVEQDLHFHNLETIRFNEAILDRIIRRKMQLRAAQLVDLSDEFVATRVPAVICKRKEEQRKLDRDATEEYLLEQMQHRDFYSDGYLPFEVFRETLNSVELSSRVVSREVLLALVAANRDGMVSYGEFVSVAADMIDVIVGPDDKYDEEILTEDEWLDQFEIVSARQTHYTIEKLTALIDAHVERTADVENAMAVHWATAETDSTAVVEKNKQKNEEKDLNLNSGLASTMKNILDDDQRCSHSAGSRRASFKQGIRMSRHQLRSILETPQLLLSNAEINLIVALVKTETNTLGVEEVLCEELILLIRRVRRMIFDYQRKCFVDRIEKYILDQFETCEKHNLEGTSKHLKKRLTQKEVKRAVRDMQKLLLSPIQKMQLVALTQERADEPDHMVNYLKLIPRMAQQLHELVDATFLKKKAKLLHDVNILNIKKVNLPCEGVVRQASYGSFAQYDTLQLGVIPMRDFYTALEHLSHTHDFPFESKAERIQSGVLADPSGDGRVNYARFQHLMYPLMIHFYQEHEVLRAMCIGDKST
ncbi:EF-hand domain pair [Plasmopara halstedii]|uniref:EF-hand domain pair n=1 Tax=Plasmopara halstedii TaxID=4781 RepID=A0A0P1AMK7_PLAHL|nr:EF-hand domain pair [Plasmopara halstedii]CEG42178.1 EF-hand domain pair [Plasmopara halstedii]|eukprot:XP_024578547.1 EF-hand domain pair [Plasmopara halstedii]